MAHTEAQMAEIRKVNSITTKELERISKLEDPIKMFEDKKVESFPSEPGYSEMKVVKANPVRSGHGEKVVSLTDMTELDEKIQQLMEKRDGRHYCKACDYSSAKSTNTRDHVERHIEGLSYPCQFCDKTFRSRNSSRTHLYNFHK